MIEIYQRQRESQKKQDVGVKEQCGSILKFQQTGQQKHKEALKHIHLHTCRFKYCSWLLYFSLCVWKQIRPISNWVLTGTDDLIFQFKHNWTHIIEVLNQIKSFHNQKPWMNRTIRKDGLYSSSQQCKMTQERDLTTVHKRKELMDHISLEFYSAEFHVTKKRLNWTELFYFENLGSECIWSSSPLKLKHEISFSEFEFIFFSVNKFRSKNSSFRIKKDSCCSNSFSPL